MPCLWTRDHLVVWLCFRFPLSLQSIEVHPEPASAILAQPRWKRQSGRMVLMIIISARFWRVSRPTRTPSESVRAMRPATSK